LDIAEAVRAILNLSRACKEKLLIVRQEGYAVAVGLGVADGDKVILKVKLLDAQAQGFYQP